jgi:hypothetical protein
MITVFTLFPNDDYRIFKEKSCCESQYIDWSTLARYNDPIFYQVIAACNPRHVHSYGLSARLEHEAAIAQFYATCYFNKNADERIQ